MPKIENLEEMKEELVDMLIQFDKDLNDYHTDVYMYYDLETNEARLDTFVNVGGNSWIDDDHHAIYTDKPHNDGLSMYYSTAAEIADALDISYEQLCREAILHQGYEEWEIEDKPEPSYDEIWNYVWNETNNGYADKLCEARDEYLESFRPDYVKTADEILGFELTFYINDIERYNDNDWTIPLIGELEDSEQNVTAINQYLESYSELNNVSLEELKDMINSEKLIKNNRFINMDKLQTYSVRMYVGALYEGDENNPDTGDFEGDIENGIFDGMLCVDVIATNEAEAKAFGKLMYVKANIGVLTDFCLDNSNIEAELIKKENPTIEKE